MSVATMKTARSRFASMIAVASLLLGAAACAPDDDGTGSTPSSEETVSKPNSEGQTAQGSDQVDLSQPSPADLSWEDEKVEKDIDCCVIRDSKGRICNCIRMTQTPFLNRLTCAGHNGTKHGSGCAAYAYCQNIPSSIACPAE